MSGAKVKSGLDALAAEGFKRLEGRRVSVFCHEPSVDRHLVHLLTLLRAHPKVKLVRVFAPEHGLSGAVQDQVALGREGQVDGVPLVTLYGTRFESLWPEREQLDDCEILLADIQDIGSRYYTYFNSLSFCMERAREAGLKVLLLDRPNPIGGEVLEGVSVQETMRSFVGWYPLPARHGLTVGELACLINETPGIGAELEVVWMEGWHREMVYEDTGLPWVLPSPNMPTSDTAFVYPGGCLIEGTNLSEGRGTTRPFELLGAPFVDARDLVHRLDAEALPGVIFRPTSFQPTFHKWAGQTCHGLQVHVTDRRAFRSWLVYVMILRHLWAQGSGLVWRREPYEFVADRPAIDLLLGDPLLRRMIESGEKREAFLDVERTALNDFAPRRARHVHYR